MYQNYFGMIEAPFSIAPDPRYLFMSQRHQEALATLLYGVNSDGGFVLLTGEVGAGKTTVCRSLLEQVPENCDVAYIFNPKLTVVELLSTVCDEFHIKYRKGTASIKVFVDYINLYLLGSHAKGRRAVLIIDEAQNLSVDVLEQMRLLTNLETNQRKLLQILLIGQPELIEMLARKELRQLAQRVVARYHLRPLNKNEVKAYVTHRLDVSGVQRQLFPSAVLSQLYRISGGVPRIINLLCDRALLGTYVQGKDKVDKQTLAQAAKEMLNAQPKSGRMLKLLFVSLALLTISAFAFKQFQQARTEQLAKPTKLIAPHIKTHTPPAKPGAPLNLAKLDNTQGLASSLQLPVKINAFQSKNLANAALLKAWGVQYNEAAQLCDQASTYGLHCWSMRGGLEELRKLNIPVVLEMLSQNGQKFYATLAKLDEKSATFEIGTQKTVVSLAALAAQWTGNYSLVSRFPPELHENIKLGEGGLTVDWVSKQLASIQGWQVSPNQAIVFDETLKQRVKEFQLSQGLIPYGFAGPRTMLSLSAAADQTAPRLSTTQAKN